MTATVQREATDQREATVRPEATVQREAHVASGERRLPPVPWWRLAQRVVVVFAVFASFGWRWLLDRVGPEHMSGPVALRRAFEVLGPTYVKLGQLVGSGEALFPQRYSNEFRKLFDRVPPFESAVVLSTLERELGVPVDEAFGSVDPVPLAAASIAQVHAATLKDGREVVVKVQRPDIAARAACDVALVRGMAKLAELLSVRARRSNPVAVIEDFEANLVEELDFRHEQRRMREFNDVMRAMGNESVAAPIVYDALSSPRVLTMERFTGWRLDDTEALLASGYDAEERLLTGIRAWFQTLILRGFFHGDVHAGNFMLLEDGRVGYLDFGIVGVFDEDQRTNMLEYVLGFQSRDFVRVARSMLAMGSATSLDAVDAETLGRDLSVVYAPMLEPSEDFNMRELIPSLLRVSREHSLRMPRDVVLVTKQLVYLDRYTRAIGGAKMNVLTDQRLTTLIMQDMFAAMLAA